jgi:hypothetical protein
MVRITRPTFADGDHHLHQVLPVILDQLPVDRLAEHVRNGHLVGRRLKRERTV